MSKSMLAEIHRLRTLTVAELRVEWLRLNGESTSSRNKDFLWRRLAWRVQELAHGGLSDRAKHRIQELAPDGFVRAVPPREHQVPTEMSAAPEPTTARPKTVRDLRLPSRGTVITRTWRGRDLRLVVLEDGFELDGVRYDSLSEAARAVTGQRWNGPLFWGLRDRKRGK